MSEKIIAYKAMDKNMQCRGAQLREAGITWEMLDEQEGLLKEPDYPA